MNGLIPISDAEFELFRKLIFDTAGISMAPEKKTLVASRLSKRLAQLSLNSFRKYAQRVADRRHHPDEMQMMVDLLTTNETYFFREPKHFDFLSNEVLKSWSGNQFRVWSAACSTGEEVYTIAMLLAERLGKRPWEVYGSDISTRVLKSCTQAVYPLSRLGSMPDNYLHKYCLKGVREQEGMFMVDRKIRERCQFHHINLMECIPSIGQFDVIFLRNVMIYFDIANKAKVVNKLVDLLKPNGHLLIGHSESLHGITDKVKMLRPSIYTKQ